MKKAWSAETIRVDRVGREPVFVERPALTLGLTMQPGVLESLRNARAFRGEGVLGRILFAIPAHGLGARLTGRDVPILDPDATQSYGKIAADLLDSEPESEEGGPHRMKLSEAARDLLASYEAEIEQELADGARLSGIRDWAGKIVGQSVRIATLIELASRAEESPDLWTESISRKSMESGVRIAQAFTTHALAVFGATEMDVRTKLARRVLNRLRESNAPGTEADLWRSMRNTKDLNSPEHLREILDDLADRGCVRLHHADSTNGAGRPPSPRIELRPELRPQNPDKGPLNPPKGNRVDLVDAYPDSVDDSDLDQEDLQYLQDEKAGKAAYT